VPARGQRQLTTENAQAGKVDGAYQSPGPTRPGRSGHLVRNDSTGKGGRRSQGRAWPGRPAGPASHFRRTRTGAARRRREKDRVRGKCPPLRLTVGAKRSSSPLPSSHAVSSFSGNTLMLQGIARTASALLETRVIV